MSKQRARKRAEERARKRAPKSKETGPPATPRVKKERQRSAREQRHRRRIWAIGIVWVVANALIWVFTDTWEARWFGLTITTILVPLVVWLVWDPEGRVDL
jgi:uncharacterized membrane protein YdbT with pleckstrin-like domain